MSRTGTDRKSPLSGPIDEGVVSSQAEKRLWNAVLLVAAQDARSARASLRAETQAWLTTKDFETVCEWAGQSPEGIKEAIGRILVQKSGYATHEMKEFASKNPARRPTILRKETEEAT